MQKYQFIEQRSIQEVKIAQKRFDIFKTTISVSTIVIKQTMHIVG